MFSNCARFCGKVPFCSRFSHFVLPLTLRTWATIVLFPHKPFISSGWQRVGCTDAVLGTAFGSLSSPRNHTLRHHTPFAVCSELRARLTNQRWELPRQRRCYSRAALSSRGRPLPCLRRACFPQSSYFMPLTLSVQSTTVFSPSSDGAHPRLRRLAVPSQ